MESSVKSGATGARASRRARRRAQTRAEIAEAARQVLARDGLAAFTIERVARELELTKPAVYYYFASKEALLFELALAEHLAAARAIHDAVERTDSGADALEALIRTFVGHYLPRMDRFKVAYLQLHLMRPTGFSPSAEELARLRPINDLTFGGTEARLRAELERGALVEPVHPRRLAFLAQQAAVGMLHMKYMVESVNDPLIHGDADLLDELCATFRARARLR